MSPSKCLSHLEKYDLIYIDDKDYLSFLDKLKPHIFIVDSFASFKVLEQYVNVPINKFVIHAQDISKINMTIDIKVKIRNLLENSIFIVGSLRDKTFIEHHIRFSSDRIIHMYTSIIRKQPLELINIKMKLRLYDQKIYVVYYDEKYMDRLHELFNKHNMWDVRLLVLGHCNKDIMNNPCMCYYHVTMNCEIRDILKMSYAYINTGVKVLNMYANVCGCKILHHLSDITTTVEPSIDEYKRIYYDIHI